MPDDTRTVLDELDSKLTKSAASLDVYARAETRIDEHHRLLGKAEGLRLARSYIQDRIPHPASREGARRSGRRPGGSGSDPRCHCAVGFRGHASCPCGDRSPRPARVFHRGAES